MEYADGGTFIIIFIKNSKIIYALNKYKEYFLR